jgi:hypothetical protein
MNSRLTPKLGNFFKRLVILFVLLFLGKKIKNYQSFDASAVEAEHSDASLVFPFRRLALLAATLENGFCFVTDDPAK